MRIAKALLTVLVVTASPQALADDCSTDCGAAAAFRYPCPTFGNPGRKCTGRNPARYASCETAKRLSCQIWDGAVNYATPRIRPMLEGTFNAGSWRAASENGDAGKYMAECIAAGVAACGALGVQLGGPWGGVISGAMGVFVSDRICEQSKAW